MMWWKVGLVAAVLIAAATQPRNFDWSKDELTILRSLSVDLLGDPPADPSNAVADNPAAAAFGRSIFFDARFSSNGRVSCASCHQPANGFTDPHPVAQGVQGGTRRTMPIVEAVYSPWQFWDGRADSLWAQALGPIENPLEHNFTRTEVAHLLRSEYRQTYEKLFGPFPDISDEQRFPRRASPSGDVAAREAWRGMTPEDRRTIKGIFANFGKSVAAFERTLRVRRTRLDRYIASLAGQGSDATFTRSEKAGLKLFIGKAQCVSCHSGPMLSNQGFANTGVPERAGLPPDDGRAAGARAAAKDPFNCKGAFSDAGAQGCEELEFLVQNDPEQVRAYKVPSLRGVQKRAPYMHAGQLKTLEEVVAHYNRAPVAPRGTSQLRPLNLSQREQSALVAFLKTLGDEGPSDDR